jgi:hypothetical protein
MSFHWVSSPSALRNEILLVTTNHPEETADGRKEATPEPILKLPAKSGDTWTSEFPHIQVRTNKLKDGGGQEDAVEDRMVELKHKVGKEEEVQVPAGKFKAIPVETVGEGDSQPQGPTTTT